MRIIGGYLKGRTIHPPKNFRARPTTDMAKEGLFNILSNRFDFNDLKILDLFSGSGNISFEFASRGCKDITCVEKDIFHFRFIKKTIEALGLNIMAVHDDSFRFMELTKNSYDLIFADPPFDLPWSDTIPARVFAGGLMRSGGLFILEHSKDHDFSSSLFFKETRKYGHVHFSFFQRNLPES